MNMRIFRATSAAILALALLWPSAPSRAQQNAAAVPAAQAQAAPAASAPAVSAPTPPTSADAAADAAARPLKSTAVAMHELSPWSMFMSADVLVKAVMIGLAFASLVTWTIFIAKIFELSLVQRRLRAALRKIGDARSLAEAQFALGAKDSVL